LGGAAIGALGEAGTGFARGYELAGKLDEIGGDGLGRLDGGAVDGVVAGAQIQLVEGKELAFVAVTVGDGGSGERLPRRGVQAHFGPDVVFGGFDGDGGRRERGQGLFPAGADLGLGEGLRGGGLVLPARGSGRGCVVLGQLWRGGLRPERRGFAADEAGFEAGFEIGEDGFSGSLGGAGGFGGGSGCADDCTGLAGEGLTVAGRLGVTGGDAGLDLRGFVAGWAGSLGTVFDRLLLAAAAMAVGGEALIDLLLPGGRRAGGWVE